MLMTSLKNYLVRSMIQKKLSRKILMMCLKIYSVRSVIQKIKS